MFSSDTAASSRPPFITSNVNPISLLSTSPEVSTLTLQIKLFVLLGRARVDPDDTDLMPNSFTFSARACSAVTSFSSPCCLSVDASQTEVLNKPASLFMKMYVLPLVGAEIDLLAETVPLMRCHRLVYAIILPAVYQIIMPVFVFSGCVSWREEEVTGRWWCLLQLEVEPRLDNGRRLATASLSLSDEAPRDGPAGPERSSFFQTCFPLWWWVLMEMSLRWSPCFIIVNKPDHCTGNVLSPT